jgi:pSer/pThr/pTyr-binding forkhead associated (FHA) protein
MAIFIIQEAGQQDRRYQIRDQEIRCGRGEGCQLNLPHTTVSRQHFKLERIDKNNTQVTPLSDQALLVNGQPIKTATTIKTRDILQVGKFTLIYFGDNLTPMDQFFEGKGLDEFPPYTRTANSTKADDTFVMSVADAKKLLASNNLSRNAKLKTADGSQEWVPGKEGLKIGKNQDVPISGWLAGSLIAEIKWVGSAHQIESKGGWTKVLVNGAKLEHPRRLMGGDKIQIGAQQFVYSED